MCACIAWYFELHSDSKKLFITQLVLFNVLLLEKYHCLYYSATFDDSTWHGAVVSNTFRELGRYVDGANPQTTASWIWTSNWNGKHERPLDSPVCCRVFFGT